jgi:hypothetical protein
MATPLANGNTSDYHLRCSGNYLLGGGLLDLVIQVVAELVHQARTLLYDGLRHHLLRLAR